MDTNGRRLVAEVVTSLMADRGLSMGMLADATGIRPARLRDCLDVRAAFTVAELELIAAAVGARASRLVAGADRSVRDTTTGERRSER